MSKLDFTIPFNPIISKKPSRLKNMTGQRFDRLLVVSLYSKHVGRYFWLCMCDCWTWCVVRGETLRNGGTRSCGCFLRETAAGRRLTHGESSSTNSKGASPEYEAFQKAKSRCTNLKNNSYKRYGQRGIEFRFESWSTKSEQARNRSSNTLVSHNGQLITLAEWSEITGLHRRNFKRSQAV